MGKRIVRMDLEEYQLAYEFARMILRLGRLLFAGWNRIAV